MLSEEEVEHEIVDDVFKLKLNVQATRAAAAPSVDTECAASVSCGSFRRRRCIENVRNCDIYVGSNKFLFYADVHLFKFHCPSTHQLNMKAIKNPLLIRYNTKESYYQLELPCISQPVAVKKEEKVGSDLIITASAYLKPKPPATTADGPLKRLTDQCRLQLDAGEELLNFDANFAYGFASNFSGKLETTDEESTALCVSSPHTTSPLQRTIDREVHEMRDFSRDAYKLNFIEMEVPEGHDSPLLFCINFNDTTLIEEEAYLLHNLTCKDKAQDICDVYEADCGLISILLAICYDVRTTQNEPTCESGWTRSTLSSTLSYFEAHDTMEAVFVSFMRRSLIYPLYRNFEFGYLCVKDAICALQQKSRAWILKQLLITHQLFEQSSNSLLNRYYIEDYIRYVHNDSNWPTTTSEHLKLLERNLRNVLLGVCKENLRLGLREIEMEFFSIFEQRLHAAKSGLVPGIEEEEVSTEDDEYETDTSVGEGDSEDVEEEDDSSVFEQRLNAVKL